MFGWFKRKPESIDAKQTRYVIVLHSFWMDSHGFELVKSEATTRQQAEDEAAALAYRKTSQFNHVAYFVIEVNYTDESKPIAANIAEARERLSLEAKLRAEGGSQ